MSPERQERHDRQTAWRRADARTRYAEALFKADTAEACYLQWTNRGGSRSIQPDLVPVWRQAVALQILTPAPDKAAVTWKRRAAKDRHLPIDRDTIDRAIATDEEWLAAHSRPQHAKHYTRPPQLKIVA
jgi:hypothetical protein